MDQGEWQAGRKTALITGASSGIGRELAPLFARDMYNLVLVARTESALQDLGAQLNHQFGVAVRSIPSDLSVAGAAATLCDELATAGIEIDALVNNAGFGTYGPFAETPIDDELRELQLNIVALTHLTKLCLPGMIARRFGRILNVASTAAFLPGPLMAVYYASKAYVLHFSEALAEELLGSGVSVTALCPGSTPTGFNARAGIHESRLTKSDAATVARAGYLGMRRGKRIVVPGLQNKVIVQAERLLPRSMVPAIVKRVQRGRKP